MKQTQTSAVDLKGKMSRATVSKSRADKSKDKDKDRGGSTSVPVPPVNTDVIPGRFTETDW